MSTTNRGSLYLGTQGFSFKDWVGSFYPPGTTQKTFLEEYSRHFPTVEIDSTFYGVPRETTIESWKRRTPEEFLFAAKFPRLITHEKKLDRAQGDAEHFVRTMQGLGNKLAVLTMQFAYDFTPELFDRLDDFLSVLPEGPRYAVEVRNRQWLTPNFGEMLSNHNVALVLQDLHYMPKLDWITADFTVIRWLGRRKDIDEFDRIQIDRTKVLDSWAEKVHVFIEQGFDVFGYFNNHFAGHSPASVRQFGEVMGVEVVPAMGKVGGPRQLSMDVGDG
jgi:uncharacterized protein YecE (DUF72 family)